MTLHALCLGSLLLLIPSLALAQPPPLRIGVLTDLSGPSADLAGRGSVVAATLAVQDAGGVALGRPVEVVTGDTGNSTETAAAVAARWYDIQDVSAIVDVPGSGVALAVQDVARRRDKIALFSGPATSELTGRSCSPTTFAWTYDTVALAAGTGAAIVAAGGRTWFFLAADYASGHAVETDIGAAVRAGGGGVLGALRVPADTTDYTPALRQAAASHADVVAPALSGADLVAAVRQAAAAGLPAGGQKLAGLLVSVSEIHSLGLQLTQGWQVTESFYWDQDDRTRAFADRFAARMGGRRPTAVQAGVYSAVAHYLKALARARTVEGTAVADAIRALPVQDFMTDDAPVRPDGRVLRDFYLFEVKAPADSHGPWDLYRPIRRIPAADAARPLAASGCPLRAGVP